MVYVLLSILFLLAFYWEYKDYHRMYKRPYIKDIKNTNQKIKELTFYSTYNYKNNIYWRSIFIISIISILIINYIMKSYSIDIKQEVLIICLIVIFLVQYFVNNFKVFHLYRIMSSKITNEQVF